MTIAPPSPQAPQCPRPPAGRGSGAAVLVARNVEGELDAKGALEQCMSLPIKEDAPLEERKSLSEKARPFASHVVAALAGALTTTVMGAGRRRRS